jgi:hypothetical protein
LRRSQTANFWPAFQAASFWLSLLIRITQAETEYMTGIQAPKISVRLRMAKKPLASVKGAMNQATASQGSAASAGVMASCAAQLMPTTSDMTQRRGRRKASPCPRSCPRIVTAMIWAMISRSSALGSTRKSTTEKAASP